MKMSKWKMLPGDDCCGCSACALACPTGAIRMAFAPQGGYRPTVDEAKCVNCGACVKHCTVLNAGAEQGATQGGTQGAPQGDGAQPLTQERVYIAVVRDRGALAKSSSGGVAYALAARALEMGMPVCGVTYDEEGECAAHTVCTTADELPRIQGSKYLQSANEAAFRDILQRDQGVIFGTPCQIAGADALLRRARKRDCFLLVDIFCHGVPNQLLWKNHVAWLRARGKVTGRVSPVFRQGKHYRLKLGKYAAWYNEDAFYTFFLRGWLSNPRCYACHLRRSSCADLRLGDCMVPKYAALAYSPSCVLANTEKGVRFLEGCSDLLEMYPERYAVVDGVQEKENRPLPAGYAERLAALQAGKAPEELIRDVMRKGRVKSFVKHELLARIRKAPAADDLKAAALANNDEVFDRV